MARRSRFYPNIDLAASMLSWAWDPSWALGHTSRDHITQDELQAFGVCQGSLGAPEPRDAGPQRRVVTSGT